MPPIVGGIFFALQRSYFADRVLTVFWLQHIPLQTKITQVRPPFAYVSPMHILKNRWFILAVLSLTWGSSFILIKRSLISFTPVQIGSIRIVVSGLALLWIGLPAIRKMDKKTLFWTLLAGALGNFLPMYLFPLAQVRVSSSMAGILDSLVPVFVLLFGFLFFKIHTGIVQWAGVLLGLAGALMLMVFSGNESRESHIGYSLLIVLATACYGANALLVNTRLAHVRSLQLSASVFTFWMVPSALMLFFSGLHREGMSESQLWQGAGFLLILSVVGTALAIFLYFYLIQSTSAVFASMVTYLLPVVAVFWGLLAGEQFTVWYATGGMLILAGIYLVQKKDKRTDSIEEAEPKNHPEIIV